MSLIPDPLQLWRKALTTLEGSGNAMANKAMGSGDFASALHQIAKASIGMQQTFEKVLAMYFRKLDLPSRKELAELTAAVQRVEMKLDALTDVTGKPSHDPRPPRTRRPAAEAAAGPTLLSNKTPVLPNSRPKPKAPAWDAAAAAKRPAAKRVRKKP